VVEGVSQVVVDVEDQDRALKFWTETVGFAVAQDVPYGGSGGQPLRPPATRGGVKGVPTAVLPSGGRCGRVSDR
jgi:hypothetical protein